MLKAARVAPASRSTGIWDRPKGSSPRNTGERRGAREPHDGPATSDLPRARWGIPARPSCHARPGPAEAVADLGLCRVLPPEVSAECFEFPVVLVGGLRIGHLQPGQGIEDDPGGNEPGVPLVVGGDDVPRGVDKELSVMTCFFRSFLYFLLDR